MRKTIVSLLALSLLVVLVTASSHGTTGMTPQAVSQAGKGRILSPSKGQSLKTHSPTTISWQLDNPSEVESVDLLVSVDGGTTFLRLASQMRPGQNHLDWSPSRAHACEKARCALLLRDRTGGISYVIGDEFSIQLPPGEAPITRGAGPSFTPPPRPLPPPNQKTQSPGATVSRSTTDVAGTPSSDGARAGGNEPGARKRRAGGIQPDVLNAGGCYGASNTNPGAIHSFDVSCTRFGYGGEPALAFDPTTTGHCHTATGTFSLLNTTGITPGGLDGFSSYSVLNSGNYVAYGDITTEIGADGTVYVVSLGLSPPTHQTIDSILIWRSTNGGASFGPAVAVPGLPGPGIDKPVITVHPSNRDVLAITFFTVSGGRLVNPYVAICNRASSSSNLGDPGIWNANLLNTFLVGGMHPIIDPVSPSSPYYWLFVVLTDDGPGADVIQYQVNNSSLVLGSPLQVRGFPVNGNAWSPNDAGCTYIEQDLRATMNCNRYVGNDTKAAIDYCTDGSGAHRMYIPTLADTRGFYANGSTCDLFVTVWQYAGGDSVTTSRVEQALPDPDKQMYTACAATDGHGGIFVTAYIITPNYILVGYDQYGFPIYQITYNYNSAQPSVISINRFTGAGGTRVYLAVLIPQSSAFVFLGDYVYSAAGWIGPGAFVIMPTFTDWLDSCGKNYFELVRTDWG